MELSLINQFAGSNSTGSYLGQLLERFSHQPSSQFRVLVAFASLSGLRQIEAQLRRFLDRGCSTFWIVGIDLGGTGWEALQFLYDLARRYPRQVDARVLTTGNNHTVFHPKVFWLDSQDERVVLVGSSNATGGGLQSNFEVSTVLSVDGNEMADLSEQLDYLWVSYSSPLPPLKDGHLLRVDRRLIGLLRSDQRVSMRPIPRHPLKNLVPRLRLSLIPRVRAAKRRSRQPPQRRGGRELIMDILEETRQTQVQIPVDTFGKFFDARRKSVLLRLVKCGVVEKADRRPLIHLPNKTHRIEIDAIRGLPRPQILRMRRDPATPDIVDYELVLRGTRAYSDLDTMLASEGQQTRQGARRWLVRAIDGS